MKNNNATITSPYCEQAQKYIDRNYSVIPLEPSSKRPRKGLTQWQRYSKELSPVHVSKPNEGIGLVLGKSSGVVALDFDYDVDGLHKKIIDMLGPESVSKKGEKGFTSFFKYNEEKNRSWSKNGETVIELLSDCKYTVMPPSVHPNTGQPYKFMSFDELLEIDKDKLPSLPENFVEKLDKLFGRETMTKPTETKRESTCSIKEIREALGFIKSTGNLDYNTYLNIGMALKDQLEDEGFDLWYNWASKADNFNEKDTIARWKGLKGTGVTIKTLFHMAIKNGFEFREKVDFDSVVRPIDILDDILDMKRNGLDKGLDINIGSTKEYFHIRKKEMITVTGYPGQGKSEFIDSVIYSLMKDYDYKALYCSFEKQPAEHVEGFIHKFAGTPIEETSEDDIRKYVNVITKNCSMINMSGMRADMKNIKKLTEMYKRIEGLDCLVLDPYNFVESKFEIGTYQHANEVCKECVRIAEELNITVILVAHPKVPSNTFLTGKEKSLPRITQQSIAGGSNFAAMSSLMLSVYRIPNTDITNVEVMKARKGKFDKEGSFYLNFNKEKWMHEQCDEGEF